MSNCLNTKNWIIIDKKLNICAMSIISTHDISFMHLLASCLLYKTNMANVTTNYGACDTKKSRPLTIIILVTFTLSLFAWLTSWISPNDKRCNFFLRFWFAYRIKPKSIIKVTRIQLILKHLKQAKACTQNKQYRIEDN